MIKLLAYDDELGSKITVDVAGDSNITLAVDEDDDTLKATFEGTVEYGRVKIPDSLSDSPDSEYYWETTGTYDPGTYEVHVFVGIIERDISSQEVNVGLIQELSIYDVSDEDEISRYVRIGASHLLNYTGPATSDHILINRTLQGSRIINLDTEVNKFKIMVLLPNHGGGGTGRITGGYLHYKKIN